MLKKINIVALIITFVLILLYIFSQKNEMEFKEPTISYKNKSENTEKDLEEAKTIEITTEQVLKADRLIQKEKNTKIEIEIEQKENIKTIIPDQTLDKNEKFKNHAQFIQHLKLISKVNESDSEDIAKMKQLLNTKRIPLQGEDIKYNYLELLKYIAFLGEIRIEIDPKVEKILEEGSVTVAKFSNQTIERKIFSILLVKNLTYEVRSDGIFITKPEFEITNDH